MESHANARLRLVLTLVPLALGACATTLPAPPTQTAPHDAPGTVGEGRTEVTAGGGMGGAVFDGAFNHGEVTVRHGVAEATDVSVRATAGRVSNTNETSDGRDVDAWRGIVALRLGLSRDFVPGVLSGFVGIGGGASGAGGFMGVDYGLSLGYDNRFLVPFGAVSMTLSTPITRPTLDFTGNDDSTPNLRRAYRSIGFGFATGARVPFGGHRSGGLHTSAFTIAFEGTGLFGNDIAEGDSGLEEVIYFGFYAGLSHTFGGRRE